MDKSDTPRKKAPRKATNKVRVKLPGIESYEKTLHCGRVVVRLERLMGSDRIRITDPKYLSTLVERLEDEEAKSWGSRSRLRKKAEKNRSRQLAIEGLMEPADDMLDLYEHPVFRVNRVLNRLAVFDTNMGSGSTQKMPPIVQADLFTPEDDSGRVFKTYSQHQVFLKQTLPYAETRYYSRMSHAVSRQSRGDLPRASHVSSPGSANSVQVKRGTVSSSPSSQKLSRKRVKSRKSMKTTKSLYRASIKQSTASVKPSGMDISKQSMQSAHQTMEENAKSKKDTLQTSKDKSKQSQVKTKSSKHPEEGSGDDEGNDSEDDDNDLDKKRKTDYERDLNSTDNSESLQDLMVAYGVPSDINLVHDWQAFKSHLVERVYEEYGGSAEELYELAGHVIGTYNRQLDIVDEFVEARETTVREQRRKMGLPSDPKLAAKVLAEQRAKSFDADDDDNEEDEDAEEDEGAEEGDEDDDDADKHLNSKAWSQNKSKSKGDTSKSKSNMSKSKSRTVVDGEGEDEEDEDGEEEEDSEEEEEEEEEEAPGLDGISVTVTKTQEDLAAEDSEDQENEGEGGEEEEANEEEENE